MKVLMMKRKKKKRKKGRKGVLARVVSVVPWRGRGSRWWRAWGGPRRKRMRMRKKKKGGREVKAERGWQIVSGKRLGNC